MALSSGLSRLCNTRTPALRKEPSSLPRLALQSSAQGSWVQTPTLQAGRGHDCPMLGVPGLCAVLPNGNGRCHGALALAAQWASRPLHLLGALWRVFQPILPRLSTA